MLDIVSIGNATIDTFICIKGKVKKGNLVLPTGSKEEIDSIFYATGGGATNTATGFRRLGLKTGVLAAIGYDPAGQIILRELREEGINTKMVMRLDGYKTAYSAILTGHGHDRIILVYGGATRHLGEERRIHWTWLKQAKWIHLTSFHSKPGIIERILGFAEKNGISVSFNPGMSEIRLGLKKLSPILNKVEILLLNRAEAGLLTREKNVKKQLAKLQELVPIVVITDGKKGAHAFDGMWHYYKPCYDVKIADTTGAGDAFHSGFVAAIVKGHTIEKALDYGNGNAQSTITHFGAKNNLLTQREMELFLKENEKQSTRVVKEKAC